MSVGLVVNPAIRVSAASPMISSRSAPSANMRVEISSSTASPRGPDRVQPDLSHARSLTATVVEKLRDPVCEVPGKQVWARAPCTLVRAIGIADEHGPAPGGLTRSHIGVGVAEHPGGRYVERQGSRRIQKHPGGRL